LITFVQKLQNNKGTHNFIKGFLVVQKMERGRGRKAGWGRDSLGGLWHKLIQIKNANQQTLILIYSEWAFFQPKIKYNQSIYYTLPTLTYVCQLIG
jgi:hypothetical protein